MTPEQRQTAEQHLAMYGYTLTPEGEIVSPKSKASGVILTCKGSRYYARRYRGDTLLWSGPDVGAFVVAFWFAARVR